MYETLTFTGGVHKSEEMKQKRGDERTYRGPGRFYSPVQYSADGACH